ncbi:MAG: hypothetical protein IBX55_18605 [Methyloprofundus sp.]|nr:hypothetical protein [Methyloprofundus sp.]
MKIKIEADSHETLTQVGNYFRILEAGGRLSVTLYLADGSSRKNDLESGMAWKVEQEFRAVEIYSETTQTIEYVTSFGEILDSRISGSINTTEQGGAFNGLPLLNFDVNAKTIPQNLNRRELHISASDTNAGLIWLGSKVTGAGIPIDAGEKAVIYVNSEMQVYADNLADKLYLAELI